MGPSAHEAVLGRVQEKEPCRLYGGIRRLFVSRSWTLQTWIEMAKYGIGANAMMRYSEQPREHDKHIMDCCPPGRE